MQEAPSRVPALLGSATAVLLAGAIGASFGPQSPKAALWYAKLNKPKATPPGPAIAAVWFGLESLLTYAGYRLLTAPPQRARSRALTFWGLSLAGLAGFPAVFFGRRRLGPATAVSAGMLASSIGLLASAAKADRQAATASIPLVVWLGLATTLSADLWRRN
jgi:tryptophan-rich sensory protein